MTENAQHAANEDGGAEDHLRRSIRHRRGYAPLLRVRKSSAFLWQKVMRRAWPKTRPWCGAAGVTLRANQRFESLGFDSKRCGLIGGLVQVISHTGIIYTSSSSSGRDGERATDADGITHYASRRPTYHFVPIPCCLEIRAALVTSYSTHAPLNL